MEKEKLLTQWCDSLIKRQLTDLYDEDLKGGFLCPACKTVHGRGDNAIYPFYYLYSKTKDEKYKNAADLCFEFQKNYICSDGGVYNDGTTTWKGITVFSAISYLKTLINFEKYIDNLEAFRERCLLLCRWVYKNLDKNFPSNINYQCAAALCMALAGEYFKNNDYILRAKEGLSYGMAHFTENGILYGEAQPHDTKSKKGCVAIDIGYNVEESVPALAEAAIILKDKKAQDFFADVLLKQLDFMLPDGAWDNSFTCRNYKWTYYGSRTSDGCAGVYMMYGAHNPVFVNAADRNLDLMQKCTVDGLLAGGRYYKEGKEKPCVHHTFTHAVALTDALLYDTADSKIETPIDDFSDRVKYYPELDSFKVYKNGFLADFSSYDINRGCMTGGGAYARGGSMTLLYHKDKGLISAASVFAYPPLAEPTNQQLSLKGDLIANLTPRAEIEKQGQIYATCLDNDATVSVTEKGVCVNSAFCNIKGERLDDVNIEYSFLSDAVKVKLSGKDFRYVFPLINEAQIISKNKFSKRKIFSLIGGFSAEEYTFESDDGTVEIMIKI